MNTAAGNFLTLAKSTAIYRNLMYHRALILEPIRQMAFRNMRHLSDAMANHPKPEAAGFLSPDSGVWIEQIQAQMLSDQGLNSSELNRLLVHKSTFTPVKLYEALLYAEIEFLDKWKNEFGLSGSTILHEFLLNERDFSKRSEKFRHGILHPNSQSIPSEEAWVSSGFQNDLPAIQKRIDSIIDGVKGTLHSEAQAVLLSLPAFQRWHCYWHFLSWMVNDDASILNDVTYNELTQEIDRLVREYSRICRESDSTQLTAPQRNTNRRLFECMKNLHPPGGEDVLGNQKVQPELKPGFLRRVEFLGTPPSGITAPDRHLNNLVDNLPNYNFIIDAVGILLNETQAYMPPTSREGEPGGLGDPILVAMDNLTFYERQFIAGLAKVSIALLFGLIRPYQNICRAHSGLANQQIDAVINDNGAVTTIRDFRNIVFHVADPTLDPYRLDDLASLIAPETEQVLLDGFSKFLGSIGAYARANVSATGME